MSFPKFPSVQKLVTLNDLELRNGPLWPFCVVFDENGGFGGYHVKPAEVRPMLCAKKVVFDNNVIIVHGNIRWVRPKPVH